MMHKLLAVLVFAVLATVVQSGELEQSSLGSHDRMIKRVAALDKRTGRHGKDCGSDKWGSSGSWSHEGNAEGEDTTPQAHHRHRHHHHHHHHGHHHHHHHHHHHAIKEEGKETSATSATNGQKAKQKIETPKQEPSKEKVRPNKHHDKGTSLSGGGLIDVTFDGKCPHPKASKKHPNGCIEFLNCNMDNGWSPAHVRIEQLKIASADEVVKGDVFKPCGKYLGIFKSVAKEFNIHPTILMSIAMQESHCSASLTGPNGEISLMQITPENCRGNCWDVYNNIRLGALELSNHLKHHDGNFLLAAGEYNGWRSGMTTGQAKDEQWGCFTQPNLDYLHQMVNGWLMGKDGYAEEFLVYNNLAKSQGRYSRGYPCGKHSPVCLQKYDEQKKDVELKKRRDCSFA